MAAFLASQPFTHDSLGTFVRKHGDWIGSITLPHHGKVELHLAGDRKAPSDAALELAAALPSVYATLESQVAEALFETGRVDEARREVEKAAAETSSSSSSSSTPAPSSDAKPSSDSTPS